MAPVSLYLFLLSEPIVRILLTDKWIEAVPYMQLYFIAGFIFMLTYFNSTTLLSDNKPSLYLSMIVIQKVFIGVSLVITYKMGISNIIIGWLIAFYLHYLIYEVLMYKHKYSNVSKYFPMVHVVIALVPSYLIYIVSKLFISNQLLLLIVNTLLQPMSYFLVMHWMVSQVYKDFVTLVVPFFPKFLKGRG